MFDIEKTHLALVLGVCFDVFWVLYMISLAYVMIRGYYLTKNEIVHKLRIEVASYMAVFSQKA